VRRHEERVQGRSAMLNVAASRDEQQQAMPGDSLVRVLMLTVTHAITIDASPERIRPSLAQMGTWRGGGYSYDRIDDGGRPSAHRNLSQFQEVAPGDILPWLPEATEGSVVAAVATPRDLILIVPGRNGQIASGEHRIAFLDSEQSRSIVRSRVADGWERAMQEARAYGRAARQCIARDLGPAWLVAGR